MVEDQNKPNYYSITPASVRYDKRLKPNAKLLYGEITALCNEKGYCWAKNSYFAGLYEVDDRSVSRWVSELEKNGYIKTKLIYKTNSKEIERRLIFISDPLIIKNLAGGDKNVITPPDTEVIPSGDKNVPTPPDKNVKQGGDKNVSDNTKIFNDNSIISLNSTEEAKKYFSDNNFKSDPEEFWDFYEEIGWKKGKNKITDRIATARRWEKKHAKMFPEKHKKTLNDANSESIKALREQLRSKIDGGGAIISGGCYSRYFEGNPIEIIGDKFIMKCDEKTKNEANRKYFKILDSLNIELQQV